MKKITLVTVVLMVANLTGCSIADTNPFEVKEARQICYFSSVGLEYRQMKVTEAVNETE